MGYMEFVSGGTLKARINELGKLDVNLTRLYAKQIIQALDFMHTNDVVHHDLKPANVLVTIDGQIKVADFGTAFDLSQLTNTVEQTFCGTPAFIAPEVIRRDKHTTRTDIWSLGVVIYNMVTGDIPFRDKDKFALLLQIGFGSLALNYPSDCPKVFRELIGSCLQVQPNERPTAKQLLQDPIFSQHGELAICEELESSNTGLITDRSTPSEGSEKDLDPCRVQEWLKSSASTVMTYESPTSITQMSLQDTESLSWK